MMGEPVVLADGGEPLMVPACDKIKSGLEVGRNVKTMR